MYRSSAPELMSNGYGSSSRGYRPASGLTAYAANNSTAMAAPFELNPEDIARLDEEMTTHVFRDEDVAPRYYSSDKYDQVRDEENFDQQRQHVNKRMEEVGRLVSDIAMGAPNSDNYLDLSPLQLRRSTSDAARNKIITPPISSSPGHDMAKDRFRRPLAPVNTNYQNPAYQPAYEGPAEHTPYRPRFEAPMKQQVNQGALYEMQQMYEQRIDAVRAAEQNRLEALDAEYKQKLTRLQHDMNTIVEKQESVMRLKGEVEAELQKDLDRVRTDLRKEQEHRRTERSKYEAKISELQNRVEDLQRRLKKATAGLGENPDKRSVQTHIAELQQRHDQKTANLIKQFEREKESALQIMKTRIKSEVNLLVPRIRQQCQAAFNDALRKCQEQTATRYREKYSAIIKRLKEEAQAEKRFIQKHALEAAEAEKTEYQKRLRSKYEVRALELKNECERRLLERIKRPSTTSRQNVSFAVSTESEEDSLFGNHEDSFMMQF